MIVKLNTGIASAIWSYAPGEIADVDADLAKAWIGSGIAERVPASVDKPAKKPSK